MTDRGFYLNRKFLNKNLNKSENRDAKIIFVAFKFIASNRIN